MLNKSMNKLSRNVKYEQIRTIPKVKPYTICPYEQKQYWRQALAEFEKQFRRTNFENNNFYNFTYTTLPPHLRERVTKLIPNSPTDEENFENLENDDADKEEKSKKSEKSDTKSEEKINSAFSEEKKKNLKKQRQNWIREYATRKRRERVTWNTKLYDLEKDKQNRPSIEKAEDIMNAAAERFAKFVNNISADKSTDITKEMIRSLFEIHVDNKSNSNINTDKRFSVDIGDDPRKLSKLIASNPEFIEFQKMKKKSKISKKPPKVAFGRTLSVKEDFIPLKIDKSYEPYFPEELRTGEIIFSGICNLKVTKDLIKYYMEHDELKRPEYLVKNGYFNQTIENVQRRTSTVPLCELVKK